MLIYKGYEIKKVTAKDWIIYKDNHFSDLNNKYERNAYTLKEAKARIDMEVER